jgi:hypothetical protein
MHKQRVTGTPKQPRLGSTKRRPVCVYVGDGFVLPDLRRDEIEEIASGMSFDRLAYRFLADYHCEATCSHAGVDEDPTLRSSAAVGRRSPLWFCNGSRVKNGACGVSLRTAKFRPSLRQAKTAFLAMSANAFSAGLPDRAIREHSAKLGLLWA